MDKLKTAEIIADAATPAVESAMEIGKSIAETLDKPVEVVFEVIQKTPLNVKKAAAIAGGVLVLGALTGAGYWYWTKKKRAKKVIMGEVVETDESTEEELQTMIAEQRKPEGDTQTSSTNNGSKHKK